MSWCIQERPHDSLFVLKSYNYSEALTADTQSQGKKENFIRTENSLKISRG